MILGAELGNTVMGQNFVTAERDQLFLLPSDARDWLPGRHLAWAVLEAAGELDMTRFTAWYRAEGQGRPTYHPWLMVALVMYRYCKGIRSGIIGTVCGDQT
jgi:transposase